MTMIAITTVAVVPAFCQEQYKSDVSVQASGSFVKSTTDNTGVQQSATDNAGVLASYRFFFKKNNGVELDYGYGSDTQSSVSGSARADVRTNIHEVTAAYVLRFPARRWSPFVLAGVSGLIFAPSAPLGGSAQAQTAFVYGGGADFNLTPRMFLRAEYRGFVYNSPTFDVAQFNGSGLTTHRAEPSVGFGYRFR